MIRNEMNESEVQSNVAEQVEIELSSSSSNIVYKMLNLHF